MGRVTVIVSPAAVRTELVGRQGDAWKLRVAAPPTGGRANAALVAWLATLLDVPRADVRVVAGASSRRKTIEVSTLDAAEIGTRLAEGAGPP